jgi:hypothetical protein
MGEKSSGCRQVFTSASAAVSRLHSNLLYISYMVY